jgi:hypothetical protein
MVTMMESLVRGRILMERRLIDLKELCQRYPFKPWTVRTYCCQARIPHIKIGRRVYFHVDAIEDWLKEHERPAQEVIVG